MKKNIGILFLITALALSACGAPPPPQQGFNPPDAQQQPAGGVVSQSDQPAPVEQNSAPVVENSTHDESAPHTSDVDLTHLELGDGKASANPQVGYVFSCNTQFNGGGAQGTGTWMNGDGTWDATKKAIVDGSVTWSREFTITVQGDRRVFAGNDLPDHPTGNYPVSQTDDAYAVDRNPNSIKSQTVSLSIPANPSPAAQPNCVGGEVGILLSGVAVFSAFDAEGRDAVAHEVQDACDGHPQRTGFYHYHSLSDCVEDASISGHSSLVGYAFDGYGIYGYYGEDGKEVTNEDLDVCHGHTGAVEWEGQLVEMYHYHATHEFPYMVGCFHGTPLVRGISNDNQNGGMIPQNGQNQIPSGQPPVGGQGQGGGMTGQPPQEAITACANLPQGAACSFSTPNGTVSGTCQTPPSISQMMCVPVGGRP